MRKKSSKLELFMVLLLTVLLLYSLEIFILMLIYTKVICPIFDLPILSIPQFLAIWFFIKILTLGVGGFSDES